MELDMRKEAEDIEQPVEDGVTTYYSECPFCKEEGDYDLPGLKWHLIYWCEVWETTEDIRPPLLGGRS